MFRNVVGTNEIDMGMEILPGGVDCLIKCSGYPYPLLQWVHFFLRPTLVLVVHRLPFGLVVSMICVLEQTSMVETALVVWEVQLYFLLLPWFVLVLLSSPDDLPAEHSIQKTIHTNVQIQHLPVPVY